MSIKGEKYRIYLIVRHSPASKDVSMEVEGVYGVGRRYQTTTVEDTTD
jgi:hypothetical protein